MRTGVEATRRANTVLIGFSPCWSRSACARCMASSTASAVRSSGFAAICLLWAREESTALRMRRASSPTAIAAAFSICGAVRNAGELRIGLGEPVDGVEHDGLAGLGRRQVDRHHEIGAGEKRFVDRAGKIAGRQKEKLGIVRGELVELGQNGVGRPVDIDRVGFHAHLAAVGGERLDLIEQDDAGARGGFFRQHRAEKVRDGLLGLAVRGARQGVRIDLDVGERAVQRGGGARGKAARQRGLARAGRADKENDAVGCGLLDPRRKGRAEVQGLPAAAPLPEAAVGRVRR